MAAIRSALSSVRLDKFRLHGSESDCDVLARYCWNLALGMAFVPVLHMVEVTLRNTVDVVAQKTAGTVAPHGGVPSWLDLRPSLLHAGHQQKVIEAKAELRARGKPLSPGRLIAELSFGFWMKMFDVFYDQGAGRRGHGWPLWTPANLHAGFPNMPKRNRQDIRDRLDEIRVFRNRVSHHEPIFHLNLHQMHLHCRQMLEWMNLDAARAVRSFDGVDAELNAGPGRYHARGRALVVV